MKSLEKSPILSKLQKILMYYSLTLLKIDL